MMGKTFETCDSKVYYNCSDAPKLICNYVCLLADRYRSLHLPSAPGSGYLVHMQYGASECII